jgi:hypothetical protein
MEENAGASSPFRNQPYANPRYLKLKSVRALRADLDAAGIGQAILEQGIFCF